MVYLTATTTEKVFTHRCLDYPLRIVVLILIPISRLLFVGGLTLYCIINGIMNYTVQMTKRMWTCEWHDWSIYDDIKLSQDRSDDEDEYFRTLYVLKCLCAMVPGILLGILPFIPFAIMVLLISLYRLPINIYKTMKVALFTVVLKWDLKIGALLILPVIHVVFILVVFVTALIGSFFHFVYVTTESITNSESPFHRWDVFRNGLEKYYEGHQNFTGENQLGRFDHPTGIPSGWRGETYQIPIQRILKWQWDFLVCCFLLLISLPICFTGSLVIFTLKLVPSTFKLWMNVCEHIPIYCWPCTLLTLLLTPAGVILFSVLSIVAGTLKSFRVPAVYLVKGYGAGLRDPFAIVGEVDRGDCFGVGCRVFQCLPERPIHRNNETSEESKLLADAYWDRFASQCILSTSELISKGWISLDDVESIEPALVTAIPAIGILEVLAGSANNTEAQDDEDILWTIDGTLSKREGRPRFDNMASLFWPKVMSIKRLLDQKIENRKVFAEAHNVQVLRAMICNNAEHISFELNVFIDRSNIEDEHQSNSSTNREIRSRLIELTLMLLRVKPYQDRMGAIFEHKYGDTTSC